MRNKGYTLIELLGVMIILALLVSFVIPSIINTIKSSTDKKNNLTNDLIINAAEMYIDANANEFYSIYGNTYCVSLNTLIENDYLKGSIELDGKDVTNLKSVKISYTDKYSYEIVDNNACVEKLITYNNGQDIYFDVEKGTGCTKEEYESSYDLDTDDYLNSKTGYNGFVNNVADGTSSTEKLEKQNSCLKFYVFNNDNTSETINLLLDHNTTAMIAWNLSFDNTSGPKEVIEQLKIDTDDWKGTQIPQNYIVSQGEGFANYTIDYSTYKARLITAGEIARITVNETFDESISNFSYTYYVDNKKSSPSETCTEGNISACKYGWLYDRTNSSCENYGCLNNSDIEMDGYWTSTSSAKGNTRAWYIYYLGNVVGEGIASRDGCGVRPVIEVLKTNL